MPVNSNSPAIDPQWVVTYQGRYGPISSFRRDDTLGPSIEKYGEWAEAEIDLLRPRVPLGAVVLDIGANVGTHTLALARHVGPTGQLHAFEPQPQTFALLNENIRQNNLASVAAHNIGLAQEEGSVRFASLDLSQPRNFAALTLHAAEGNSSDTDVRIETVDSFSLKECYLFKIDVEGMEAAVLAGARNTISRCRPLIYAECNRVDFGINIMRELGGQSYSFWLHHAPAYNPNNFFGCQESIFGLAHECNILAVPSEKCGELAYALNGPNLTQLSSTDDLAGALHPPQWNNLAWEESTQLGLQMRISRLLEEESNFCLLCRQTIAAHGAVEVDQFTSMLRVETERLNNCHRATQQAMAETLTWLQFASWVRKSRK